MTVTRHIILPVLLAAGCGGAPAPLAPTAAPPETAAPASAPEPGPERAPGPEPAAESASPEPAPGPGNRTELLSTPNAAPPSPPADGSGGLTALGGHCAGCPDYAWALYEDGPEWSRRRIEIARIGGDGRWRIRLSATVGGEPWIKNVPFPALSAESSFSYRMCEYVAMDGQRCRGARALPPNVTVRVEQSEQDDPDARYYVGSFRTQPCREGWSVAENGRKCHRNNPPPPPSSRSYPVAPGYAIPAHTAEERAALVTIFEDRGVNAATLTVVRTVSFRTSSSGQVKRFLRIVIFHAPNDSFSCPSGYTFRANKYSQYNGGYRDGCSLT